MISCIPYGTNYGRGRLSSVRVKSKTVLRRYGGGDWAGDEYREHKHADILAAASEALHVTGWSHDEVRE